MSGVLLVICLGGQLCAQSSGGSCSIQAASLPRIPVPSTDDVTPRHVRLGLYGPPRRRSGGGSVDARRHEPIWPRAAAVPDRRRFRRLLAQQPSRLSSGTACRLARGRWPRTSSPTQSAGCLISVCKTTASGGHRGRTIGNRQREGALHSALRSSANSERRTPRAQAAAAEDFTTSSRLPAIRSSGNSIQQGSLQGGEFRAFSRSPGLRRGIHSDRYQGWPDHRDVTIPWIRREKSEIEIGWTFLARSHWGGLYNGEMKRLMLHHAFQFVDSVVFLIGPQNCGRKERWRRSGLSAWSRPDANGRESVVFQITPTAVRSP